MGYAVYEDFTARDYGVQRWAGYGVPAECDWPSCHEKIDRGMGYRCETIVSYDEFDAELDEEESEGCGLHFCGDHSDHELHQGSEPKPDIFLWLIFQSFHDSWADWRRENPDRVKAMRSQFLRHPVEFLRALPEARREIQFS